MPITIKNETEQKKRKRWSIQQEKDIAKSMGGRLTPASGAKDVLADVRVPGEWRIEAKSTHNKSYRLTRDLFNDVAIAGSASCERPAVMVRFLQGGKPVDDLVVIRYSDFKDLVDG